jgi:F0F1-type ATP synthase gamma subunit
MFWAYSREDTDKVLQKFQKFYETIKKNPEKHAKAIFPAHHLGEPSETGMSQGITIYESDDEEKLIDYIVSYYPEMRIKIVPLLDSAKTSELYLKMKKQP